MAQLELISRQAAQVMLNPTQPHHSPYPIKLLSLTQTLAQTLTHPPSPSPGPSHNYDQLPAMLALALFPTSYR